MTLNAIECTIRMMDAEELFQLNNLYCKLRDMKHSIYFKNDENYFNAIFSDLKPFEIVQTISLGCYDHRHEYVRVTYANRIQSVEYISVDYLCDKVKNITYFVRDNFEKFQHLFN
jgi:hypothetical protein